MSNEWIFESKASEGQFDPNVADLWDESDMSERLKILSSSGITGDFDMAINGWSNLPLDVQITLEEINVAELRGESLAKENKTYTCDKCGKVGDSFTGMAQEECPADVNANHQIPIFGDQVKPRGIGEEHYSMHFDQAYNVNERLSGLFKDFMIAILLVAITLLPLGLRAALVVMISIPLSLAIGIIMLNLWAIA